VRDESHVIMMVDCIGKLGAFLNWMLHRVFFSHGGDVTTSYGLVGHITMRK
jgi:hypothetical protein